ncbi:MAG: GGDEF domain-containing protein [Acidobacteria bacterium]|nr:GGDEF domain-containing protein [Acidobacteriota bacterium]
MMSSLLLPGGVLLVGAIGLVNNPWFRLSLAAVNAYYAAALVAGLLLAWRFHSTRVFFTLIVLLLSARALSFFSGAPPASAAPAHMAFAALATLLPLNFLAFACFEERGFTAPSLTSRLFLIFIESVFVALLCRPDHVGRHNVLTSTFVNSGLFAWTRVPQLGLLAFSLALLCLFLRFCICRKPIESGSLWALVATALAWHSGGLGADSTAYLGTSALILLCSLIETSYVMAYHDELTGLPGRRAFNQLLLALKNQYTIAIIDIDHFKSFNDTYGHDTGDEVLRMVASRLAAVTGGGKAFRLGGEEFAIVFAESSAGAAFEHLEGLRETIATSGFKVRHRLDRRKRARSPQDRRQPGNKQPRKRAPRAGASVSVTVSIGVAEASEKTENVDQIISAADQALYRAKKSGRNRVEAAEDKRLRAGAHSRS